MSTAAERYRFTEVESDGKNFLSEMFKNCKVHDVASLTKDTVLKMGNKEDLANCLMRAMQLFERQHNYVINLKVHVSSYQEDIIKLQSNVIDAQNKALQITDRISGISKTVQNSVETVIKKSYSEAVGKQEVSSCTAIPHETLKSVAKQIVVEEELSKNVMIFGLPESENEDICESVGKVFEELNEKPRMEASRVGKKTTSK